MSSVKTIPENNSVESKDVNEDEAEIDYGEVIDQNHLDIVTNLDLDRHFVISYLRTKAVIDEEDCDLIRNTGSTRQQKVSIFLDIIKRKGDGGIRHFINALEFEHPCLYEKCTGKKPATTMAPAPHSKGTLNWIDSGLAGKEYIDFDRAVLCKQLEQTVSDLHWITRSLHKVQEEKNILEKRLVEAHNKVNLQEEHIEELKGLVEKASEIKRLSDSENAGNEAYDAQLHYLFAAQHDMVRKTNFIIGLQAQLLAQTEEIERMKMEKTELKESNKVLTKEVNELTLICDKEKRMSKRLNEQVLTQHGEIKQVESYRIQNRELRLKLSCLQEERDSLCGDLEEFRKYSEVLNAKYTMLSQEKLKLKEHREEISTSYQSAQEKINDLTVKLSSMKCEWEYVLRNNERLQSDVKTYREFQKRLHEEIERLRAECEEAWKAVEKANDEAMKSKRQHDEAIHNQMVINLSLDNKYRTVMEELDDVRQVYQQTNEELVRTKKRLGLSTSSGSFSSIASHEAMKEIGGKESLCQANSDGNENQEWNSCSSTNTSIAEDKCKNNGEECRTIKSRDNEEALTLRRSTKMADDIKNQGNGLAQSSNISKQGEITAGKGTWKRRANKDLLDSIRKKLSAEDDESYSLDTIPQKGLLTFEQLRMMYNLNEIDLTSSLPAFYSEHNCLSLPIMMNPFAKRESLPGSKIPKFVSQSSMPNMATSIGDANTKKIQSPPASTSGSTENGSLIFTREPSADDSVFEHSLATKLNYRDCVSPSVMNSARCRSFAPQPRKADNNKDEGEDYKNARDLEKSLKFRKRSFLLDANKHRRRSTSAPPPPSVSCTM